MKTIKAEIELYQYDELNEKAKENSFNRHFEFLCDNPSDYDDGEGNIKYLTEEDYNKEAVEESIRINEYWFFKDGDLADCVTYTGEHEKTGKTELKFQGKIYLI